MGHQRERQPQRLRGEREVRRRDPLEAGALGHHRARHQHLLVRLRVEELEQRGEAARHLRRHARHVRHRLHVLRDDREQEEHRRHHLVPRAVGLDVGGGGGGGDGVGDLGALAHLDQLRLGDPRHLLLLQRVDNLLELGRDVDLLPLLHFDDRVELARGVVVLRLEEGARPRLQLGRQRDARAPRQVLDVAHKLDRRLRHAHKLAQRQPRVRVAPRLEHARVPLVRQFADGVEHLGALPLDPRVVRDRRVAAVVERPVRGAVGGGGGARALEGGVDRGGAAQHDEERLGDDRHHALKLVGAELGELRLDRLLGGGLLGGGGLGGGGLVGGGRDARIGERRLHGGGGGGGGALGAGDGGGGDLLSVVDVAEPLAHRALHQRADVLLLLLEQLGEAVVEDAEAEEAGGDRRELGGEVGAERLDGDGGRAVVQIVAEGDLEEVAVHRALDARLRLAQRGREVGERGDPRQVGVEELLRRGDQLEGAGEVAGAQELLDGGLRAPHGVEEADARLDRLEVLALAHEPRQPQRLVDEVRLERAQPAAQRLDRGDAGAHLAF